VPVLVLIAWGAASAASGAPAQSSPGPAGERFDTVVVDAGHGGDDHGAAGPEGLLEKDVVLEVARRVAERLQAQGLRVVLTRDHDLAVPLPERTRIANEARADLFVSIHANSAPSRLARGMETYFLSLDASDEASGRVAARENEAFGRSAPDLGPSADPLSAILGDLANTEHLVDSDEFARLTHARLAAIDPVPSRGVKQAPFVVLMGVRMPAALVEIGFITNPKEARGLAAGERQGEIADAIAAAVLEFGRRYDARRGAGAAAAVPEPARPPARGEGDS
jgi:N-acetylmuramoyl-L-alanine amidase